MAYAVLTREANATLAYADALRPLGLEVVAMPVTRTEPLDAGLDRVLRETRFDAIVCASARAATALLEAWNTAPRDVDAGRTTWVEPAGRAIPQPSAPDLDERGRARLPEVWVVGRATAEVLAASGLRIVLDDTVRDGGSLARAMVAARSRRDDRVLIPRSRQGRTDVIEALVVAGAIVETVDVYSTMPAPIDDPAIAAGLALLRAGAPSDRGSPAERAAICALFAPSQVDALETLVGIRTIDPLFAAIGETTAQALRGAGAGRIVVATEPTPEGLANAIRAVYPTPR
jgi:uroporphyrinogen-III synthase